MQRVRTLFVALRLVAAAAIVAAVVAQLQRSLENAARDGQDVGFMLQNFFSFFTIDSNVLAAATMAIGAVLLLVTRGDEKRWYTVLRLVAVTYMTVTLIVYNLLLRGIELPQGQTVGWSNEILHVVGPLLLLVDWLFAPGRARLEWNRVWVVVVFPIVWAAYTLIRGPFAVDPLTGANWYPYPFLNPGNSENGYLSVAFYVILISAIMIGVGSAAVWVTRRGQRWPLRPVVAASA